MKKKIALSLCLAIAPTLITLLSSLTPSAISSSLHPLIPSSLNAQIPADGLVAWYPFNGNANDESGNGNNGTVNGATLTTDRFGNANGAFNFSSSSNQFLNFHGVLGNFDADFSINVWFLTNGSPGYILSKRNDEICTNNWWVINPVGFEICQGIAGYNVLHHGVSFQSNTWHNYVISLSGNQLSLHVDGVLTNSINSNFNYTIQNSANLLAGIVNAPISGYVAKHNGRIDDIAIYNRALSSPEIQQLYQDQTGQVQQPLTCSITAPVTSLCAGSTTNLMINSSSNGIQYDSLLIGTVTNSITSQWNHTFNTTPGKQYKLVANALYTVGTYCPQLVNDPAFQLPGFYGDSNPVSRNLGGIQDGLYCTAFAPNDFIRPTPDVYNPNHVYSYLFTAVSNSFNVGFNDCCWGDNCGNAQFTLYEIIMPSILWSNGASTSSITVTPTTNTTYSCTVTQGSQTCTASVDITVNPNITNAISATIIEGESYTLGAQTLTTAGTYTEVFTSAVGCDSTVTLTLAVEPLLTCNITATTTTLCAGESVNLSISATGGAGSSSQLPVNLQQGLVAYYPFNGNANDESGNGNHGTVNGATLTSDRFGNGNEAYSFDGNAQYISVQNSGSLSPVNLTISVWYRVSENYSEGNLTLLSKMNHSSANYFAYGMGLDSLTNKKSFGYSYLGCSEIQGFGGDAAKKNYTSSSGDWYMLSASVTADGFVNLYQNGQLIHQEQGSLFNPCNDFESLLHIGHWWDEDNQWFNGKIDDIAIYNRALSPSEIQQLYTTQSFAWNTGATTSSVTVTPTTNTTYSCTVTQGSQTCTATVDIIVNPNVTNAISANIIEGETYTLGAQTLTTAGTYTEVFASAAGCDSTVTLTLAVEPLLTCNITAPSTTLCAGESVDLSISATGGAGSSSQLPANLQQGLVAYYPFNGNANDESGNGNDGTIVNGATFINDRFGNSNSAITFDGVNDYIDLGDMSNSIDGKTFFTISYWATTDLNFTDYQGWNVGGVFSHWIYNGQPTSAIGFQTSIYSNGTSAFSVVGGQGAFSQVCISPNVNSMITIVYDGTNVESQRFQIFSNGQFLGFMSPPTSVSALGTVANKTVIGGYIGPDNDDNVYFYFKGILDDLVLFNRALFPSEIQQLYTAQSFAWNTGETTSSITITPTNSTTYSCTVTQGNSTCIASIDITVNPSVTNAISVTIIEGETYTLGTQTLTTAGTYTEVFSSATGCDSTVTLTLAVEPLLTCNISAPVTSICEGESITLSMNTTGGAGSSSQLPANLQQGLVAYYPFNGNANDESGNGNDGVVFGNVIATSNRLGELQSAFDWPFSNSNYNSNAYIDLPNMDLQFETKLTISFWIYKYSGANGGDPRIFGRHESGLIFNANSSNIKVFLGIGISGFSSAIPENQWVHIVYTSDSSMGQGRFYINGVLVHDYQTTPSNELNFSNDGARGQEAWNIGRKSVSGFDGFGGKLDEIFFYNRVLNLTEIQQLYTDQSYAWSTGDNFNFIIVSPSETTTYTATVTTATQTCTDSITITVNPLLDWYADADGDGFGDASNVVQDCNQPAGFVADNSDCNDEDAITYPGAEEICDNNRDDNCDGQVDENCTILGCTDPSACNYNEMANTDDNSCVLPQPEICDGLDNNCNNQIDEGLSPSSINAVAATTALYPVCSGNSIKSANLNNGANSAVIDGSGNDLWYSFTAQFNTFRAGLSAASGDNDVRIYTMSNGGCLELIETEHETTNGNQTLLTDQLTVGQTYYVAVHNISGPMNASAKICFNHLNASLCDHYYSNNTGIYTSVCNSFKAQYRANAVAYTFEILSATQNGVNQNITPWSYTTPSASTVVARLGTLLPANQGTSPIVYTMRVPVLYSLFDAAGNFENLYAQATATCTATLNAEPTIALRSSDRCPNNKSITSTIAPDRTVCGAVRYDWEFTEVLPISGTTQVVQGGAYASAFFLSNVPGVAPGKTYNVRVRPVHSSGVAGNWGSTQCLRIGNAGMILENHPVQTAQALVRTPLLSLRAGGEMNASYSIYPNPTASGIFVLQYNGTRRGELIFAQQPNTTESNSAQEPTTTESNSAQEPSTTESTFAQELVMMDITGKLVYQQHVVLNGNAVEVQFGHLASGVYLVMVGEERMRLIVE